MNDLSQVSTLVEGDDAPESVNVISDMSVGGRLSAGRQQRNWSIQHVAEQLKLSQGQILALESNQFEKLPKLVIVRGFVRAYAKLLKIDADNLIALLPRDGELVQLETSLRPALSTPFVDSRLSLLGHHDNNRRYIIGAIFLIVLVVIFLVLQKTEFGKNLIVKFQTPSMTQSASDELVKPAAAPQEIPAYNDTGVNSSPAKVESAVTSMPTLQGSEAVPVPGIQVEEKNVLPETSQDKLEAVNLTSKVVPATEVPKANSVVTPAATASADVVVFKFRENSWIQVKTDTGAILVARLAKAGTEESFNIKQGLQVRIGNAAGVDALLRGQPLTISSERGSNVANFTVK
ncbi:helix-turn-helix domain-containing protein [Undibacterium sp. Di24W]|uniref:helix-turn-helix domain-containing protein n=1 Tax=Undibacterium sp. Di24W TaxID=3413033 RepID=UPI003BF35B25